ncbi:hypothetical protein M378DRAFT_52478, partial [Amanita muscaria Koide BX008]
RASKRLRSSQDFQQGAEGKRPRSACTICLGRKAHDPKKCFSKTLWDNSKAHCSRNKAGYLVNPQGFVLCTSWNQMQGCEDDRHPARHECSGCGEKTHGAQTCPRTQVPQS